MPAAEAAKPGREAAAWESPAWQCREGGVGQTESDSADDTSFVTASVVPGESAKYHETRRDRTQDRDRHDLNSGPDQSPDPSISKAPATSRSTPAPAAETTRFPTPRSS